MRLIIDIGNSRVKYFFEGNTYFTIDDLSPSVNDSLDLVLVSTVPQRNQEIIEKLESRFSINQIDIFDAQGQDEIKGIYSGIGPDRVAKLIGARRLHPNQAIILMDFGTATTITAIDQAGTYLAGYISLGFEATLVNLADSAAELPNMLADLDLYKAKFESGSLNADSTEASIVFGTYLAHQSLVDSWLKEIKKQSPQAITICTGGGTDYFKSAFDFHILDRDLLVSAFNLTAKT